METKLIESIESVLQGLFDEEIEYFASEIESTRLRRISKEISKFGGVRD